MVGAGSSRARIVLSPDEGETVWLGRLGVRFMIDGKQAGETFALVEHPMKPRVLAAPMHTHQHEDETPTYSRARLVYRSGTRSASRGPET